jgi:spore germination cell wall hydrolase CwlJ-like protein
MQKTSPQCVEINRGQKMKQYIMAAAMLILATNVQANDDLITEEKHPEHYCMALNIYYEARGSNLADKVAVSDVVLNRVNDTRYPNTVCEVVKQGKQKPSWKDPDKMVMVRNACQFSWYCDGKADNPQDEDRWFEAQMLAWQILEYEKYRGITEGATHYHATYVSPKWAKDMQLVGRIGAHIFYRWE